MGPFALKEETVAAFGYDPSSLKAGSAKPVVFRCEFCLKDFVSSLKSSGRTLRSSCSGCRSMSASYSISGSNEDTHEFFLARRFSLPPSVLDEAETLRRFGYVPSSLNGRSKKKVVAKCEFCLSLFETSPAVLMNKPSSFACKKCDAVSAAYSRLKSEEDKHSFFASRRQSFSDSCLDIKGTMRKFGYVPGDLSSYSTSRVVAICAHCDVQVFIPFSKFSQREGRISCWKCMRKKTVDTLRKKYGVECTLDIPSVREKLNYPVTERIVEAILKDRYGVEYVRGHCIGPYSFDFFVPSCNLLIECQGDYFHDFKANGYSGLPKDRSKLTYVERYTSHKLVWIWEHEIHMGRVSKILDHHIHGVLEPELSFSLKNLSFRPLSSRDAHSFLSQYHYLGNLGNVSTCFGAFSSDLLVSVGAFGGVTRNQTIAKINLFSKTNFGPKQVRELRRFCIRPGAHVKNLASFCLSRYVSMLTGAQDSVAAIVSFSDPTVGDLGTIYKASNWSRMKDTVKSYHYLDTKTGKPIHKKTVWDSAKGAHMSEAAFSASAGLMVVEEREKHMWLHLL